MLFLVSVNQLVLQIIYPLCEPANAFVVLLQSKLASKPRDHTYPP